MLEEPRVRVRALHQLLDPIRPETKATQADFDRGKKIHFIVESCFPELNGEKARFYDDRDLPFRIAYHPDLYSPELSELWEIKPSFFLKLHYDYCLAQLSGYRHFTEARIAGFVSYMIVGKKENVDEITFTRFVPDRYYEWEALKAIFMEADVHLIEQGDYGYEA